MNGIVFDLDGTLVRGDHALPGAVAAVHKMREDGWRIVFCTQDSIHPPPVIAERLDRLGFGAIPDEIISAGWIAAEYLARKYCNGPIYVIAAPELRDALVEHGLDIVADRDARSARAVYIARDPTFTDVHINAACQAIWNGADFFGVGYDRVIPVAGRNIPGAGAVVRGIEYATRTRATILGKPSLEIATVAMRQLRASSDETIIVGDQIDADIRMGKAAGCRTALVLTGGTSEARARRTPERWRPDAILPSVGHLPGWITAARG